MLHSGLQFFQCFTVAAGFINAPKFFDPISNALITSAIVTIIEMMINHMTQIYNLAVHNADSLSSVGVVHD
jgi:hypothetical protein